MTEKKAGKEGGGGRHVNLHPLAIVGVSDHLTRVKLGGSKQPANSPVLGLLFGKQTDLEVSIYDAIEAAYDFENGVMKLDDGFLAKQIELYTAVYKDKELLGWYAVGTEATSEHLRLQKDFAKYNSSPLFLLMDPSAPPVDETKKDLPIGIYEDELHMVDETPTMLFVPVPYELETLQAEQIALEQVAKTSASSGSADETTIVYETIDQSLKTLVHRVSTICDYLQKVDRQQLQIDYAALRDIAGLVDKLPPLQDYSTPGLQAEYLRDLNDSLAVSYLAAITKSTAAVHDLLEKFAVVHTHGEHRDRGHHHPYPAKLA